MAVLEVLSWPNKVLSTVAQRVLDEPCDNLIADMIETMDSASGIGLAAPQVGVSKRIVTISSSVYGQDVTEEEGPTVLINPEIIDGIGDMVLVESCLSVPGSSFWKQRANTIVVRYEDADREKHERAFSGLPAIVIQHECDHLDGITLADAASQEERRTLLSGEVVNAL